MTENMVDTILSAEEKADKSIADAKAEAASIIKSAEEDAAKTRDEAVKKELDEQKARLSEVEKECAEESDERLKKEKNDIDASLLNIDDKKNRAVEYIVGRLA